MTDLSDRPASTAATRSDAAAVAEAIARLRPHFGERLSTARAIRDQHARGEGIATSMAPDAVVWPLDKHEVCTILACCHALGVPVKRRRALVATNPIEE